MVFFVMCCEVLVTGPAFEKNEGAGLMFVRENGVFQASWVFPAERLQSVEGFLKVGFMPCFGDENRHEPDFRSLLADREGMWHLVFLGDGFEFREGRLFAVPPENGLIGDLRNFHP